MFKDTNVSDDLLYMSKDIDNIENSILLNKTKSKKTGLIIGWGSLHNIINPPNTFSIL